MKLLDVARCRWDVAGVEAGLPTQKFGSRSLDAAQTKANEAPSMWLLIELSIRSVQTRSLPCDKILCDVVKPTIAHVGKRKGVKLGYRLMPLTLHHASDCTAPSFGPCHSA
eukprot:2056251-Amphidinium_carterae.1